MIVAIDTNVLIYWLNSQSQLHAQATSFLKTSIDRGSVLVCSTLVIAEFLSKKGASLDAVDKLPIEWKEVDKTIAQIAGRLRQSHEVLKTADAIHLASAIASKAGRFITNDRLILKLKHVQNVSIIPLADVNTGISRVG